MTRNRTVWATVAAAALAFGSAAHAQQMQPGLWESTARVTAMQVPGAMQPMKAQIMAQANGAMKAIRQCLTAQQLAQDPARAFGQNGCKTSRSRFAGGVVDIAATCQGGATLQVTGSYTPTSNRTKARIVTAMGKEQMVIESESTGRRIGPCK